MSDLGLSRPRGLKGNGALGPVRDSLARLSGWQAAVLAAMLGAASTLAFAPFHVTPILLIAFTGLVWLLDGARIKDNWGRAVFLRTFAFAFAQHVIGLHWIGNAFLITGGSDIYFIWIPIVLLPAILATVWGVAMCMAGAFWSSSPSRVFVFALFLGLAEWVRGTLFGGFPWNLAGTSWIPGAAVSQSASIGGIYWLTLLTIFVMASPAALSDDRERSGLAGRAAPLLIGAVMVAGAWTWGMQRLQGELVMTDRHAVMVDAGIPFREKFIERADVRQIPAYLALTGPIDDPDDIVIWPEAPVSYSFTAEFATERTVQRGIVEINYVLERIARQLRTRALITGTPLFNNDDPNAIYNALAVVDAAEGGAPRPVATYNKHRLVPLGELAAVDFVPFGENLAGLLPASLQNSLRGGFTPGDGPALIQTDNLPPFVPLICYEVIFPEVARANAREAEWMVNISLDGWFGTGIGPKQHFVQAQYRAIETGLPLARSASFGTMAMVDPYGRVLQDGIEFGTARPVDYPESWLPRRLRAPIPAKLSPTLYVRLGPYIFWLTLVAMGVCSFIAWKR